MLGGDDVGGGGGDKGGVVGACSDAVDNVAILEGPCLRRFAEDGFHSGSGSGGGATTAFDAGAK